ncbi:MAG: methionyl-tRNA formyltransferase [Cyanobacteria bacterium REEB65]|nr:methionyl-tRNA formyltransferase [Cyanobacteria bacterium REEB65]
MADLVFMGTPQFAVPSLEALLMAGHCVRAVVTQPDRPSGRGNKLQASPVKQFALDLGIAVYQPVRLRQDAAVIAALRELAPAVACVVAYGQLLPQEVLDLPAKGCINLHGSLLPAYRGAGPVQWALIHGDTQTGVTTMLMDAGMDTGPMLLSRTVAIDPLDDVSSLSAKLAKLGAPLLAQTVDRWLAGQIEPRPQPEQGVSYAPLLKKEDGILDWAQSAAALHNRIRGTTPWPGAQTTLDGQPLKILQSALGPGDRHGKPGTILDVSEDGWQVTTGEGTLRIQVVQLAGRRPQSAAEAARGLRSLKSGAALGSS